MAPTNVEILRDGYAAFGRGDIPAVLAVFDPDIEWIEPEGFPWGRTYRGHDEVVGLFGTAAQMLGPDWRVVPDELLPCGDDHVLALGHHRGTGEDGPWAVPFAMVWQMRDGKAVRFRQYSDTAMMRAVIEGARV
jgi:uncharacterized protein